MTQSFALASVVIFEEGGAQYLEGLESISHSGLLIRCVVHGQPRVVQIKAELSIMLAY